jgi:hypothetical protein
MPRRVLVVATAPASAEELRDQIRDAAGEDAEVLVVAPASDVTPLQWLTSDEDGARGEAARRAQQLARLIPAAVVDVRVGDPDPLVVIEEALREFPADEIVIVTRPGSSATWLEHELRAALDEFRLPVRMLHGNGAPSKKARDRLVVELVHADRPLSVLLVQQAVLLVVAAVAVILIGVALILYLSLR